MTEDALPEADGEQESPGAEEDQPSTAIAKPDAAAIARRENANLVFAKERRNGAIRHGVILFFGALGTDILLRFILNDLFGIGYIIPLTISLVGLFGINRFVAHPLSGWLETRRDNMPEVWMAKSDKQINEWAARRAEQIEALSRELGYGHVQFDDLLPELATYLLKWRNIKLGLERVVRAKNAYGSDAPKKITERLEALEKRREGVEKSIQRFLDAFGELEAKVILNNHADFEAYGEPVAVDRLDEQLDKEEATVEASFADLDADLSLDKKIDELVGSVDGAPDA